MTGECKPSIENDMRGNKQWLARDKWKTVVINAVFILLTGIVLHWEGRRLWCACGHWRPLSSDAWGSHASQHFLDPYSFTHIEHGVLLCGLLMLVGRNWNAYWRFSLATTLECLWEIGENSSFIIERYRANTAAVGYMGDSMANAFGDLVSCMFGYWLAMQLGVRRSLAFIIVTELGLYFWIGDGLAINVLQLFGPAKH